MLTFNGFLKFHCLFLFRQVCEPELERKVWVKRSKELNLKTFSRNKKKENLKKKKKNLNYKKLKRWRLDRVEEVIRFICVTEIQT